MSAAGKRCPHLNKKCIEHDCALWIQVQGKNPQTGADIAEWDCTYNWLPVLLIENSQQQRQTGASLDKFRNEVHSGNEAFSRLLFMKQETQALEHK